MKKLLTFAILVLLVSCKTETNKANNRTNSEESPKIEVNKTPPVKLSSGQMDRYENFQSQFVQPRNVDVWLPDDYSKDKKYAVLYMHDGQMLFDSTTTWNKQEWQVDEVASRLMKENKTRDFIVVAMWNISEIRWQDYYPQKTWDFIPKETQDQLIEEGKANKYKIEFHADNYLKFITQEVKPFIDENYSVLTDPPNTFISGSSMGGLISMYAIFEYPQVFSGAACLSTHWTGSRPRENNPLAKGFFDYMKSKDLDPKTHKIYFDYGTETLDADYVQYAPLLDQIFEEKGFDASNFKNLKFEGAAHDEISWAKRLDIPFTFLLGNQ